MIVLRPQTRARRSSRSNKTRRTLDFSIRLPNRSSLKSACGQKYNGGFVKLFTVIQPSEANRNGGVACTQLPVIVRAGHPPIRQCSAASFRAQALRACGVKGVGAFVYDGPKLRAVARMTPGWRLPKTGPHPALPPTPIRAIAPRLQLPARRAVVSQGTGGSARGWRCEASTTSPRYTRIEDVTVKPRTLTCRRPARRR